MKKNEIIELKIEDIGVNGEGIGKYEGCTFFVKNAVIGDRVKAVITRMKKEYGFAKAIEITEPSGCRIEAPCRLSSRCGGCQIMEMSYPEQLRFKERKVRMNLERIGGLKNIPMLPILGAERQAEERVPLAYRNKMQFPIGPGKNGGIAAGFYAGRTHYIIDTESCPAAPEAANRILQAVRTFMQEQNISAYDEKTGKGLVRHLFLRTGFYTGEILVVLVLNGESLNEDFYAQNVDIDRLFVDKIRSIPLGNNANHEENVNFHIAGICLNTNKEQTNVILGKRTRCLYGKPFLFDEIRNRGTGARLRFKISVASFYQVNPRQTEKLYETALSFADLKGNETVWDLYCGIGTLSLFLAQKAKRVKGVEIIPDAIRDAKENAERNGIGNAVFYCGPAEEIFPRYAYLPASSAAEKEQRSAKQKEWVPDAGDPENREALVVLLDPPRKGCDRALLEAIREVGPERIVYVSCDSATLARDLKILTGGEASEGEESRADREAEKAIYRLEKVRPVDMFPNTVHCECAALLTRK